MARKSRRTRRLRVVNPNCAGIDIGKDRHFVAVDPERSDEPVRSFGSFTRDLEAMAAWLASCGVIKVAMESTSVYWIAVYETLERAGFEVMLVPPRMTKRIGGRKSDVLDCQWIWQLMSYGLLRGAFRPGDEVCPLRSYARQMRRLTEDRARCVLHMQKALTEMNVRLDSVIANIVGLTGQRILRAIVDGERDPERLAALRHRRVKADADTIAASLQGTWREEHLFALEQAVQRYDFLTRQIDDCEARVMAEIERLTPPDDDPPDGGAPDPAPGTTSDTASSRSLNAASNDTGKEGIQALALRKMMGVDLTAIPTIGPGTALVIASEIGPDFSAFPSAQHFCSWLALAPGRAQRSLRNDRYQRAVALLDNEKVHIRIGALGCSGHERFEDPGMSASSQSLLSGRTTIHDVCDGPAHPLRGVLDFSVPEVSVAQGHADTGVAEQSRDHRHRHAVHHSVARYGMAEVVEADILDAGFLPDPVPEIEVGVARPRWIARRRKHEWTLSPRLPFENTPGLRIEWDLPGPGLAVGQHEHVALDLGPAQAHDLAPATPGQQQEPDHFGLLAVAPPGLPVERLVEAGDLLAGEEACELRPAVGLDACGRVGVGVAARDGEVHDLAEDVEAVIGIAGRGPAERVEPPPDPRGGNAVERDRPELRQQLAREERAVTFFRGGLVALEMRVLPLTLDELPERGGAASRHALLLGLVGDLPREAIPARLRDGPERHRTQGNAFRAPAGSLQPHIALPTAGPEPDPETGDAVVPDGIFPFSRTETLDGGVSQPHAFSAGHRSVSFQHGADDFGGFHRHDVAEVRVLEGRLRAGMAEQPADDEHGLSLAQGDAGMSMAEVVKTNVVELRLSAELPPEPVQPAVALRARRPARGKHPAALSLQGVENVPGRLGQPDGSGARLRVAWMEYRPKAP